MRTFKIALFSLIFLVLVILVPQDATAQCSLCKGAVESNMKSGGGLARGLYHGILYLMAFPYLAAGIIAYFWYKKSKKEREGRKKPEVAL